MHDYTPMGHLDTWYARLDVQNADEVVKLTPKARQRVEAAVRKAQKRTSLHALLKFTERVNGTYRIKNDPPLIERVDVGDVEQWVETAWTQMADSMGLLRNRLLDRYRFLDIALKVVGVGSVGTRAYMVSDDGKGRPGPALPPVQAGGGIGARAVRRRRASTRTTASESSAVSI